MELIGFREYVAVREAGLGLGCFALPLSEADAGLRAFIDSQNRSFKAFLQQLLAAKKITDPRLVHEAQTLIADQSNSIFNYGQELLRMASVGRGRLAGADALQGASEAAGRLWELLWRPEAYAGNQTWESRFLRSVDRGGIRGTVRAIANNAIGHLAQRLRKGRASVSTVQQSQIQNPDRPFDVAAAASNEPGEWKEWRTAIIQELTNDLNNELAKSHSGRHWEARVRNLKWAIAVADKAMAIPYQWRSMPEVLGEIPGLEGIARGGLQQTIKALVDDARNRVVARIGTGREQAVAQSLQSRGRRTLGRAPAQIAGQPLVPQSGPVEQSPSALDYITFGDYIAAREGLLLPDKPARAGMMRINPFPATQAKLKRLFPVRQAPAKPGNALAPLSLASPRPTVKPIPSPLQAAKDAFAGCF